MGEQVTYSSESLLGIPIDLKPNQFSAQYNVKLYRVKRRLNKASAFSLLSNRKQEKNGNAEKRKKKDLSEGKTPNLIAVHFETAPLVYAHLHTEKKQDPVAAQMQYLKCLRDSDDRYFSICRDTDPDYQQLYTDSLCMGPLVERLSMILTLSQMGTPEERPKMLMTCLTDLETLICSLQTLYFSSGYREPKKAVLDLETGAPFGSLYNRLCSRRTFDEERALILAQADCSDDEEALAIEVRNSLFKVTQLRATVRGKMDYEAAKKLYTKWIKSRLSDDEITSAKGFSYEIVRLEEYLNGRDTSSDQKVQKLLFSQLYSFADHLQQDDVTTEKPYSFSFESNPLPPEALFLQRATIDACIEIMKTVFPYLSLDNALQGITHMAIHIQDTDSGLKQAPVDMLLFGAKPILTAAISRLPRLLSAINLCASSDDPLPYIKAHPAEFAIELRSVFFNFRQDCQSYNLCTDCSKCDLYQECPYRRYAAWPEMEFQDFFTSLADFLMYWDEEPTSVTLIPKGIIALTTFYSMATSVMARRVAEHGVKKLYQTWRNHSNANNQLLEVFNGDQFAESIYKIVHSPQNKSSKK